MKDFKLLALMLGLAAQVGGCAASYATPGRGADMQHIEGLKEQQAKAKTDDPVERSLEKKPLASFPAAIAVARIQAPGYASETVKGWGSGNYSIVTTRDVEKNEQIKRLASLPQVKGIAPINRLLLPTYLESDLELRKAAAELHADLLLIYTLDTTFSVDDKATPLTVLSLGLSPNQIARLHCTASAVLIDTRNGYVYGVAESTEHRDRLTSAWTTTDAVDQARRETESAAFDKLVGELEQTWKGVIGTYAASSESPVKRPL